jgi:hypothetical protein
VSPARLARISNSAVSAWSSVGVSDIVGSLSNLHERHEKYDDCIRIAAPNNEIAAGLTRGRFDPA